MATGMLAESGGVTFTLLIVFLRGNAILGAGGTDCQRLAGALNLLPAWLTSVYAALAHARRHGGEGLGDASCRLIVHLYELDRFLGTY